MSRSIFTFFRFGNSEMYKMYVALIVITTWCAGIAALTYVGIFKNPNPREPLPGLIESLAAATLFFIFRGGEMIAERNKRSS